MINFETVKEMDISTLKDLVDLRGVPMMKENVENWERVELFQARPDDLVIATYPKAGTTWVSEIVDMIYNDGDTEKCRRDTIYNRVPYMEFRIPGMLTASGAFMGLDPDPETVQPGAVGAGLDSEGVDQLNVTPSPRLLKTHLPIHLMPESFWEKKSKVIYVARNAKDVAVSYFFFHNMVKAMPDPGSWEEFLENYMTGKVGYGSWHDHVKDWWEKRHEYHILYLFYEDLKENPKREIQKILDFLEKKMSEETLEKIVYHTSFQKMKTNDMVNYKTIPKELMDQTTITFMRKGESGDWKNHFTVAQNIKFDEDYEIKMAGSSLHFRTEI